jgi:N-acetylglutamate synthase-like GNAT family acetyltransferase
VKIRSATAADQPTIRRLIRQANLNPTSLLWSNFLIAEEADGSIAGIGQVKPHRDGSRELASIAVVPGRQGTGIGSAVIRELITRERGGVLHLTCKPEMQGYYQRFGFRLLSRAEYPRYFKRLMPLVNLVARIFGTRIVVMRRDPID